MKVNVMEEGSQTLVTNNTTCALPVARRLKQDPVGYVEAFIVPSEAIRLLRVFLKINVFK
jgi:hypothetical protein